MPSAQCRCGFTELADESLMDHLHRVFAPQDGIGTDGELHDETTGPACLCGFTGEKPDDLDRHFLAVFRPANGIGDDGREHGDPVTIPAQSPGASQ